MFTVIILDKYSSDLMGKYRFLFKPFLDDGTIGFCNWEKTGTDVKSAVPELYDIIRGKKEWRAVIVDVDSVFPIEDGKRPNKYNPFDYSEIDSVSVPHESPIPIIRLTHILAGYSASPVKEFEKAFEYYDMKQQGIVRVKENDISDDELQELIDDGIDVKSVYMEKQLSPEMKAMFDNMYGKYVFSEVRPYEINLVATRGIVNDREKASIIESWKNYLEMDSSRFTETNCYPNNCRFLTYSLTNKDNSLFERQLIEFWLSVIALSINKIPASTLQAYRLYRIGVSINHDELEKAINRHLNVSEAVYTFVTDQLHMKPEMTFDEDDSILKNEIIPVSVEAKSGPEMLIHTGRVGLGRDCPADDISFWSSSVSDIKNGLDKFLKAPRRTVDKAANLLKHRAGIFQGEKYELDQFQLDDLTEKMDSLEENIFLADIDSSIDKKSINDSISKVDKDVRKTISRRMKRSTALVCGGIALLLTLAGFIPYIINSWKVGTAAFSSALLLTLIVIAAVSVGGLAVLIYQRSVVVNAMKSLNEVVRNTLQRVTSISNRFTEYFSNICTFMHARSILEGIELKNQSTQNTSNILNTHRIALRRSMERDKEWMGAYDLSRLEEAVPNVSSFFETSRTPIENKIYYFNRAEGDGTLPLNKTGDYLNAPYDFIDGLLIEREDIYEEEENDK